MSDDSEIAITIVDDEKVNVDTATAVEAKKADDVTKVEVKDPALQDLMAQYKELENKSAEIDKRRQEAEEEASRHRNEAARSRDEAEIARKRETNSQLDTIKTAISASEQDVDGAKAAIRAAKASGDVEAEIEAQDRLAKARATLLRLDEAQQDMEARIKSPPKREAAPADPVDAFCQGRTAPTAAWIRQHPEYVRSERGLKKLTAADAVAQAEDLIPDTPEYFARVEEYLGLKKAAPDEKKEAPTEASQVKPKTAAPPVAPGSAVSSDRVAGSAVQLTKREADAATDGTLVWNYDDPSGKNRFRRGDPIGLQEAARRKLALQKQGAYDRTFTEG